MPQNGRLALMVSLPRSGKSTSRGASRRRGGSGSSPTPSAFRQALHGHAFHSPAEGIVWAAAELAVRALLIGGHAVVIDATNTTRHRRSGWLRIARELGAPAEAFVTDTPLSECLERNLSCRHRVPEDVMERMDRRFEPVDGSLEGLAVRSVRASTRKG